MLKPYRKLLPILIHASPILRHALLILTHLLGFRLSATYLITCIAYLNTLTWLHILIHYQPISAPPELSSNQNRARKNPSTSSANQNRVLRNPSRQPEHPSRHYVTRELSAPGGPFSALSSSRLAIAHLNTWGHPIPPSPDQLTLLLLT